MFWFFKKKKQKKFHEEFFSELKLIISDIIYVYKNFFHWSISRIIISIWSLCLWVILAFPFLLISVIVGLIDPIDWKTIISYIISWSDPTHELLISGIAEHMFSLVFMLFLILVTALVFLLWSSYNLLLISHLSLHYIKRKKLKYKKNLYFQKNHISSMVGLLCWNTIYFIAPFFIFIIVLVSLFLGYTKWYYWEWLFSALSFILTIIFLVIMSYVIYKILFWYVILAKQKESKVRSSRSYLLESIQSTSLRNYGKFLIVLMLYFVVIAPFQWFQDNMDRSMTNMKNALAYKTWLLDNIQPWEEKYWEYIMKEYEDVSSQQLVDKIAMYSYLEIFSFFIGYFLFNGLFILIVTSFYRRVIQKK